MLNKGGVFCGIGAALLALLVFPSFTNSTINLYGFDLKEIISFFGVGLIFLGIAIVFIGTIRLTYSGFVWGAGKVIVLSDFMQYQAEPATEEQLDSIHRIAFDFFEGDVSPLERMTSWQRHNANIFWVVYRDGREKGEIDGYFCVIPLLKSAAKKLQKEEIRGSEFTNELIASGNYKNKPYALYIGAVAARGLFAKAASLSHLYQFMNHMKSRKVRNVYTRPVSKDGLRLCKKKGFTPVDKKAKDALERIYHLDLNPM